MSYLKPLALVLLGAALVWWGLAPRIDLQADRADRAETSLADAERMISLQAGVLAEQQAQLGRLADVERQLRVIHQAIAHNAQAQRRAFEELRHDPQTADYLHDAVPAALGRLYARPATTNPAAYRGAPDLPADGLPAAGAPSAAGE